MKLYEILLPVTTNTGEGCMVDVVDVVDFLERIGEMAGGFTQCPRVQGFWRDGTRGTYMEEMIPVRVACEPQVWRNIVSLALVTFADQKSIMSYVLSEDVTFTARNRRRV